MDLQTNKIYSELRKTKQELQQKLEDNHCSTLVRPFIQGELKDIETALEKLEKGTFGKCEISGELMPHDLLMTVPTLKSMDDCHKLSYFFRKE